jgi:hypothetical protein
MHKITLLFIMLLIISLCIFIYTNVNNTISNYYNDMSIDISDSLNNTNNDFGFIITRHVNSELTNNYWITCIECIRKCYNNKIIVIDDNSNKKFLNNNGKIFKNCEFINSPYPARGELLGYYFLYHKKFFKKAVVIHDSVFFNKCINFNNIKDCKFLFYHKSHRHDEDDIIIPLLKKLNKPDELLEKYKKKDTWHLCFGVQSIISYEFLVKLHEKYNFLELINHINTRQKRMALERIFGFLCTLEKPNLYQEKSLLGDIMLYMNWGYSYESYLINKLEYLPLVKVWTGR